jgi:hypothetical protein
MNKRSSRILLFVSILSLLAAIGFGLNAQYSVGWMEEATDWGKVVLAAVFGFGGIAGLGYYMVRANDV